MVMLNHKLFMILHFKEFLLSFLFSFHKNLIEHNLMQLVIIMHIFVPVRKY